MAVSMALSGAIFGLRSKMKVVEKPPNSRTTPFICSFGLDPAQLSSKKSSSSYTSTFIPKVFPATTLQDGRSQDTDTLPTPIVLIDQDSDPNATIVEITFGDRLGALLDTMNALKNLGLNVVKASVYLDSSGKHNKFAITKASSGRKVDEPELLEAIQLTIINNLLVYHPESSSHLAMEAAFGVMPPNQQVDVDIATHINVHEDGPDQSLLYVETADRPGLLVDLVKVITGVNIAVKSGDFDTEGLLAKAKFHVNYEGKAILKPLQQLGSLDCIEVNHNIHSSFKRCKKRMSMRDSFAEELVFNILLCLPAQFIHDVMRCVCRQWYAMIRAHHFIYAHLLQSTAGLIVARPVTPNRTFFVEMQQGRPEVSKCHLGLLDQVWSSCNGLLLVGDAINQGLLHIVNPVTKQHLPLPPFFHRMRYADAGLAFVAGSQEYKVVRLYCSKSIFGARTAKCVILTIGLDKVWRHINLEHLVCVNEERGWFHPFVTGEFVHWIHRKNTVSTLNVQTETFMQFPAPQVSEKRGSGYLKLGGNLSFLAACGLLSWEILEMKSETGEWTKLSNIDLEDQRCKLEKLEVLFCTDECKPYPICWLKPREVLVFRFSWPSKLFIFYDLKTREIQSFKLEERDHAVNYLAICGDSRSSWATGGSCKDHHRYKYCC